MNESLEYELNYGINRDQNYEHKYEGVEHEHNYEMSGNQKYELNYEMNRDQKYEHNKRRYRTRTDLT